MSSSIPRLSLGNPAGVRRGLSLLPEARVDVPHREPLEAVLRGRVFLGFGLGDVDLRLRKGTYQADELRLSVPDSPPGLLEGISGGRTSSLLTSRTNFAGFPAHIS